MANGAVEPRRAEQRAATDDDRARRAREDDQPRHAGDQRGRQTDGGERSTADGHAPQGEHDRSGEPIGEHRRSGRLVMGSDLARKMPAEATMTEDRKLLERPERRERPAFLETDTWRTLRIMSEFVEGFDALADIGPAITVFGSARVKEG